MKHAPYSERRQRVCARLGDGVAIIPTAPERLRNRDAHYPYRFDSYFWYLSGFPEPEAVLVLVGGSEARSILFCREKNEEREIWDGFRYGPASAAQAFGFAEAWPISELASRLPQLLAKRSTLWHSLGHDAEWDRRIGEVLAGLRADSRNGQQAPGEIRDLHGLLDEMRLCKDSHELDCMQRAADIAAAGHTRAMRACRPGIAEYELEAELSYEFRRRGASGHAYTPIVAGGVNACILHYVANDKLLSGHSLVLIDAGCEIEGYASDITRTFPVGGRFSTEQRAVYEIVLAAQAAAIGAIRPGARFVDYHHAALRVLSQGLIDLGVLTGTADAVIESEAYKPYYMHRTGHWLGLDVHDAGAYRTGSGDDDWVVLAPGMTLTVEPGLYLRPGDKVPEHLHGIGVRIEDDVLVTSTGSQVYTNAPRTVGEIEEVMHHE